MRDIEHLSAQHDARFDAREEPIIICNFSEEYLIPLFDAFLIACSPKDNTEHFLPITDVRRVKIAGKQDITFRGHSIAASPSDFVKEKRIYRRLISTVISPWSGNRCRSDQGSL